MKIQYGLIIALTLLTSCTTSGGKKGANDRIDFSLYQGRWYEIARLPDSFEDGLKCITATYSYGEDGVMLLTNRGLNKNNPDDIRTLTGRAWIPDPQHPENIRVQFVWPVTTDYLVIHVDESKGYAIIGTPSKKFLWFLSRSETIAEGDLPGLLRIAEKNQFKTDGLVMVEHGCGK